MNAGVILISDLMYSRNNVESFNIAKDKGLIGSNYLTWFAVRCSMPKYSRNLIIDRNILNTLEFKCGKKILILSRARGETFMLFSFKKSKTFKRVL